MVVTEDEGPERKRTKFAPPTIEEVAELRECDGIYTGRLAQLKIDEIYKEITFSEDSKKSVRKLFETLSSDIRNATPMDDLDLENLPAKIGSVQIPFDMHPKKVKGVIKLIPPESVYLDGLYRLDALPDIQGFNVEVTVKLPKQCLQEKDHWDERYFRKRAIYLAYIANELSKLKKYELKFTIPSGYRIKPSLIIEKENIKFQVCIHCDEFCKKSKMAPNRSNIHFEWWNSESSKESIVPPATPLYNQLIQQDVFRESEVISTLNMESKLPNFSDGLKLFLLYAAQAELHQLFTFDIFENVARYLLNRKRILRLATGYQIFRQVLHFFSTDEIQREIIFIGADFENHSLPALVNEFGRNVVAGVSMLSIQWIQYVTGIDFQDLSTDLSNAVVNILVKKRTFAYFTSHAIAFPSDGALQCVLKRNKQIQKIAALSGDCSNVSLEYIAKILKIAMPERIVSLNPQPCLYPDWQITNKAPKTEHVKTPTLGIVFSEHEAKNKSKLFRGPPADQPASQRFKSIWGKKTEERRFQDGSICVAAHFESRDVLKDATEYLCKLHGQVTSISYAGELESVENDERTTEYKELTEAYNELEQILRSHELSMPLKIQQCWPISSSLRGTCVVSSKAITTHQPKSAHQVNIDVPEAKTQAPLFAENIIYLQLEGSSQWPQDIQAIRKLRAAYHIRLADLLTNKFKVKSAITEKGMAILSRVSGYIFKLITVYHREGELMKEFSCPQTGMLQIRENNRSDKEEFKTVIQPQLALVLSKFTSIEMSVCRIVRKWLSRHMLTSQISPLLSDLLVYAALRVENKSTCGSQVNGFYRVLKFLGNYDFIDDPIFIPSEENAESENITLRDYFKENRTELFKNCGIIVSCTADEKKSLVTRDGPTFVVVKKIQSIARASCTILQKMISCGSLNNISTIFTTSTKWMDVVLKIKMFPQAREKQKAKKEEKKGLHRIEIPGWDVSTLLLRKLEKCFGNSALFFAEEYNSSVIGVKFKPMKALKGLEGECFGGLAQGNDGLYRNHQGLINDFKIFGAEIIETVIVQKEVE